MSTFTPVASSVTSTPLACQKRVFGRDVLIVRRVDEHLQRDAPAVRVERVRHDLTDLDAPVIERRTDIERTDLFAAQAEPRPGTSAVTMGGTSRPTKRAARLFDLPTSTPIYEPENNVPRP